MRGTDEVLLRRVARGEADALTALYRRHAEGLFGFLQRLAGDRMLAEEILQDTLLAVWRGAERFEGRAQVRTWLYGIARRQAHNRLRSVRPAETALDDVPDVAEPAAGPEELALVRLDRDQVLAAVARLGLRHREVVVLAFVAELSQAEIADVVGVPVGTVKSRLHHARAALVHALAELEGTQR
ncbi:RNA polymerase sigma factor [Labedaea rhizosphaerae]|uniref:RNA polymerase sigma factor n=1 Tax=Labedaea rhizosphaerae TaxID=598644 RepID=A0A4R6S662_LABRH|nr:sigma-70 family RNA polymerase sigma factor [Labedaea rhizosphaerae]TDP94833.1 RNA polymerase sigma-70 factor (ECF subfamily) [Labedaea rhizosphaerae]